MLRFEEALDRLLQLAAPLGSERVGIDAADGRVLAEDVRVLVDAPEADTSAMDGYAVASRDFEGAGPFELDVVGEARPGAEIPHLANKTACRIFTGARIPEGADAVVIQEDVTLVVAGAVRIVVPRPARAGANVRRRGEDLAAGAVALPTGTRVTPARLGLLAGVDRAWISVARRPRVAVIGTGDELRLPGTPPTPGSVAESGTLAVRAMATRAGAEAVVCPMARDNRLDLSRALRAALRTSDLVVTVGGMSEGDYDLVRPVLEDAGVSLDFWKVAIKPGKPLGVGTLPSGSSDVVVLGLPGNPAAAVVTFGLFGVPFLRALQGDRSPRPRRLRARLACAVTHKPGRRSFLRATFESTADGELGVRPLPHQSSASIATVAHADALLVVSEDEGRLEAGTWVETFALSEFG